MLHSSIGDSDIANIQEWLSQLTTLMSDNEQEIFALAKKMPPPYLLKLDLSLNNFVEGLYLHLTELQKRADTTGKANDVPIDASSS